MEQTQNSPHTPPTDQPNTVIDHSVRSYFLQQGQSIIKLYDLLQSNIVAYGFKAFLSVVLQLFCYIAFAFAIYFVIVLPDDLPGVILMMDENISVKLVPDIKLFREFIMTLKIIIAVISLPVLICAFLLGRNRRKSVRIRRCFNETEQMKSNFDQAMKNFRF